MKARALAASSETSFVPLLRRARADVAALLALGSIAAAQSPCGRALEYGMNPSFHTWSARAIVFADAMTRAREFVYFSTVPLDRAPLIPLGQGLLGEGWPDPAALGPGLRFGARLFGALEGTLPDGRTEPYVLTWLGAGACSLEGPPVVGEQNRSRNRVEVFVDPTAGGGDSSLSCAWTATDPADPVRDVRVWLPGMERAGLLFWPPFLDRVRLMNAGRGPHTWRTLDWTRVNDYGRPLAEGGFAFDLAGMISPRSASQGTRRGMCPEFQVAFCNELGANLHLSVPHRTDDLSETDYLRFLVRTLRAIRDGSPAQSGINGGRPFAGLDPALELTIELSNEIWNPGFPVHTWMKAEAARKGITFHEQVASQIQLVFDVAEAVFDGPHAQRLRKFVGGWIADPSFLEQVLAALRPGTEVDAVGPACYFGPRPSDSDAWLAGATPGSCPNCPTPEDVLAAARRSIERLRPLLDAHARIAAGYANPDGSQPALELYEAGQAFLAGWKPWAAAAKAAQRLPGMFDIYVDDLVPLFVENGVALVNWYSFMTDQDPPAPTDPFGAWNDMQQSISLPAIEPYADEGAPKAAVICLGPPLSAACPPAQVGYRTAGANADSYRTSAPALGRLLSATVDLRTTGHASAVVMGALAPASILLPSGQALLIRSADAEFLPPRPGPIATWELRIPNDRALAGILLFTQAIHFGGPPPELSLSNAVDLRFGRP